MNEENKGVLYMNTVQTAFKRFMGDSSSLQGLLDQIQRNNYKEQGIITKNPKILYSWHHCFKETGFRNHRQYIMGEVNVEKPQ